MLEEDVDSDCEAISEVDELMMRDDRCSVFIQNFRVVGVGIN